MNILFGQVRLLRELNVQFPPLPHGGNCKDFKQTWKLLKCYQSIKGYNNYLFRISPRPSLAISTR